MPITHSKSTYYTIAILTLQVYGLQGFAQKMPECYYRAEAAVEQNDANGALQWIDSCLATKPTRYQYFILKGQALLLNQQYNDAIDAFSQAEKNHPGVASFHLAEAFCVIGDTLNCIEWTQKNLQSGFREPESSFLLNNDFKFAQRLKEWHDIWLKEWYSPIEKDIFYAKYLIENQNYDEAIELLNKRIKSKKSKAELFELRGLAHLGASNNMLALKDFEHAYHRSKRNYRYLALQARALYKLNQYSKALKFTERAIAESGGKPEYIWIKALILSELNRWDNAYEATKTYLKFYPTNLSANKLLVYCAYESGYFNDALLAIAKMLKHNPNDQELVFLRAKIYLKTDQPHQAIVDFEKTIAQGYKIPESYLDKGIALQRIGENDEACKCFSISASLGNIEAQEVYFNSCKH